MPLSKNGAYRLRKVRANIEKVMDALYQAQGNLYPVDLAPYQERIVALIQATQKLDSAIDKALGDKPPRKAPAAGKASEPDDDPFEEAAE